MQIVLILVHTQHRGGSARYKDLELVGIHWKLEVSGLSSCKCNTLRMRCLPHTLSSRLSASPSLSRVGFEIASSRAAQGMGRGSRAPRPRSACLCPLERGLLQHYRGDMRWALKSELAHASAVGSRFTSAQGEKRRRSPSAKD